MRQGFGKYTERMMDMKPIHDEQVQALRALIWSFSDAEFTDEELRTIIRACVRAAGE